MTDELRFFHDSHTLRNLPGSAPSHPQLPEDRGAFVPRRVFSGLCTHQRPSPSLPRCGGTAGSGPKPPTIPWSSACPPAPPNRQPRGADPLSTHTRGRGAGAAAAAACPLRLPHRDTVTHAKTEARGGRRSPLSVYPRTAVRIYTHFIYIYIHRRGAGSRPAPPR